MRYILLPLLCVAFTQITAQEIKISSYSEYKPDTSTANFSFSEGNYMSIKVDSWQQLDSLPAIEPLLIEISKSLSLVWDTFYKPFNKHKATFPSGSNPKLFYLKSSESSSSYFRSDSSGKVTRYKQCCDSVVLIFFSRSEYSTELRRFRIPLTITLTFKEFSDPSYLINLPADEAIRKLKEEIKVRPVANKRKWSTFRDSLPSGWTMLRQLQPKHKRTYFEPDIYVALQHVRGEWVSSAAAGLQLIKGMYEGERSVFKLLWEPHFAFTLDDKGNRNFYRNDFITFRFEQYERERRKIDLFPTTLSLGYLVRRKGGLYEDNTFKFSLPGLKYESISLEPEFFFNDFFRNFSPSLKVNLNID